MFYLQFSTDNNIKTYPYTLLDQIIFVPLQLVLKLIRLCSHSLLCAFKPSLVENRIWVVRGYLA